MNRRLMTLAFAAVGLISIACAQAQGSTEVKKTLDRKTAQNKELAKKAGDITNKLGDLAKSGKLPTDAEGIALMRKMVEELAAIQQQLEHQNEEIAALYKATGVPAGKQGEGSGEGPSLDKRISALEKVRFSGYEQFQFRNSGQPGKEESAFYDKRTRLNLEVLPDNKNVTLKVSFDLAGSTNNSALAKAQNDTNGLVTKDAFIRYQGLVPGTGTKVDAYAGQIAIPLGYELARSDADREMPERSLFNDTLFKGQRSRGVNIGIPMANGFKIQGGIIDSLSTEDPEQLGFAPGGKGRLAAIAAITKTNVVKNKNGTKTTYELGASGLQGSRPTFNNPNATINPGGVSSPEVDRKYGYLHANLLNLWGSGLDWRTEVMVGTDRVPSATPNASAGATHMNGLDTVLGFRTGIHRFDLRYGQFNPNLNVSHKTVSEIAAAYNIYIGNYKISFAREQITDQTLPNKYNITTVRLQFKF